MTEAGKLAIKAIDDMKSSEALDIDSYCKCMVELAHNFFREGDIDGCIQTIGKCPPDYFKEAQFKHMEEDAVYKDTVIYLAYKFIQMGMVNVGEDMQPTQKQIGSA